MVFPKRAPSPRLAAGLLILLVWGGPQGCDSADSEATNSDNAGMTVTKDSPGATFSGKILGVQGQIPPQEIMGETKDPGTSTGGAPTLAVSPLSSEYRRPDVRFVYVSIDKATPPKGALILRSTDPNVSPKVLATLTTPPLLPSFSIDGLSVVYRNQGAKRLYRITGFDQTPPPFAPWGDNDGSSVAWSPEEDKAVYAASDISGFGFLRVSKADGSAPEDLSEKGNDLYPGVYLGVTISPALQKSDPSYDHVIFSYDPDGDGPFKPYLGMKNPYQNSGLYDWAMYLHLTKFAGSETWPAFSPDAKRLVYVRNGDLAFCDYHVDKGGDGSCDDFFAIPGLRAANPCWADDGRVIFSTTRDGNAEIYSVNPYNAYEIENLTKNPNTEDVQPACFPPHPMVNQVKEIRVEEASPPSAVPMDSYAPIQK
ncbi:MAG TPA: hypothetical protein VLJ37_08060 [bacterium]|nr:hypothetical protein [bacterium]